MTSAIETAVRRVATYERVSSEDQRERETIKTQTEQLARALDRQPEIELVERFVDDGVSGSIPLAERPAGGRLMRAAAGGAIEEVHVYKFDRLGRDDIDLLVIRRRFKDLGVRLISVVEGEPNELSYGIQAVVAADGRRQFLQLSAVGMERAAREGRYCGGIVPLGYRVAGERQTARLEPDITPLWADLSAADVVRRIYRALALEGRSCRGIATEFNGLGIPTHYTRDGRGVRGKRTQGLWRPGRVRQLVLNPIYKGVLQYGRRIDQRSARTERRGHEVISAPIEGLVSSELWEAAQDALVRNRAIAKNAGRPYLLGGAIRCGICGLAYCGSNGRGEVRWYRCTGQLAERGPIPGRCWGKSIRTDAIEPQVWADVEAWLRNPGEILAELEAEATRLSAPTLALAESASLRQAIEALEDQRGRVLNLHIKGHLGESELDAALARIAAEKAEVERRLAAVEPPQAAESPALTADLLDEIRQRLDAGLSDVQRKEVIRLVARILVHTETDERDEKRARLIIQYRFPEPQAGVVNVGTGMGSSPQRAGTGRGTRSHGQLA